jgi:hypothetical protein
MRINEECIPRNLVSGISEGFLRFLSSGFGGVGLDTLRHLYVKLVLMKNEKSMKRMLTGGEIFATEIRHVD